MGREIMGLNRMNRGTHQGYESPLGSLHILILEGGNVVMRETKPGNGTESAEGVPLRIKGKIVTDYDVESEAPFLNGKKVHQFSIEDNDMVTLTEEGQQLTIDGKPVFFIPAVPLTGGFWTVYTGREQGESVAVNAAGETMKFQGQTASSYLERADGTVQIITPTGVHNGPKTDIWKDVTLAPVTWGSVDVQHN